MAEPDGDSNPLSRVIEGDPLSEAKRRISQLSANWKAHERLPASVPLAETDPPADLVYPEPKWISGWAAFEIFRLQSTSYEWAPAIARVCQVICDQVDREEVGSNYVMGRLPPSHGLLEEFPVGSNQWFRALYELLSIKGANEILGWEELVSDLYDWLGHHDSLRLAWRDVIYDALSVHWAFHEYSLPEAKQEPIWHFPQAMAWIATRDYIALARMQHFMRPSDAEEAVATDGVAARNTQALGWLHTFVTYAECQCGAREDYGVMAYKHCTCISVAWEELVHFQGGLGAHVPELVFNIQEGWISMTWPEGAEDIRFLRRDIKERWPPKPKDESAKPKPVESKASAERECKEWLRAAFDTDPEMKISKSAFQDEALRRFDGRLSLRGFLRVWDGIAAQAGRSKPGRKS